MNFISLLKSLGVKAVAGLAGWQAWLLNIVLNKVWKLIKELWAKYIVIKKVQKENKKSLEQYEQVINKPDATPEDIKKAGETFLED